MLLRPAPCTLLCCLLLAGTSLLQPAESAEPDYDDDEEDGEDEDVDESDVLVLTKANFTQTIDKHEHVLVEFYAPWCGYCKQLAPEYAAAATALADEPNIKLAKVDATVETDLAEQYGVEGFPDVKWFTNGTAGEYGGGRDEESILRWIQKQVGPVAETITEVAELEQEEAAAMAVLIGYFDSFEDSDKAYAAFKGAVIDIDIPVLQTSTAGVAKAAGRLQPGDIAVITNMEGEKREVLKYTGKVEEEPLRKFAHTEALPLVVPFTESTTNMIFGSDVHRHLLLVAKEADLQPGAAPYDALKAASAAMRDDQAFIFVSVDAANEAGEPVLEYFGIGVDATPVLVGFQIEPEQRKYRFTGDLTKDGIVKFAKGILDGSVEPDYASQPIPEDDTDGDVKIVVGRSFKDIVMDDSKDVLLEVYAPWCGHCQALEPVYKKLATAFKGVDSVVIAKMDGTENEHPTLEVEGYPSILLYPAKKGEQAIEFEGDRSVEDLAKFIKENAKKEFQMPASLSGDEGTDPVDAAKDAATATVDRDEL